MGILIPLLHHIPHFYNSLDKILKTNNLGEESFLFYFIFVSQFKVRQSTTVEKPWQGGAQSTIARDCECDCSHGVDKEADNTDQDPMWT